MAQRKFANMAGGKVKEMFFIDDALDDFEERTAEAIELDPDADVRLGDAHDGGSFKEREPELHALMRATVKAFKHIHQNVAPLPDDVIALFQKIKDSI